MVQYIVFVEDPQGKGGDFFRSETTHGLQLLASTTPLPFQGVAL